MNKKHFHRLIFVSALMLLASCTTYQEENAINYGDVIPGGTHKVYGKSMKVEGFQKAVVFTYKGKKEVIKLRDPSPMQPAYGDIGHFYNHPYQPDVFGKPLQGEHIIFNDQFRAHIFEKGVVIWEKQSMAIQPVVFEEKFIVTTKDFKQQNQPSEVVHQVRN